MGYYVASQEIIDWIPAERRAFLASESSGNDPDETLIESNLVRVEGEINAIVAKRTTTTITQADHPDAYAMIAGWVMAIAIFQLAARRPGVPEDWRRAHDIAREQMTMLIDGKMDLPGVSGTATTAMWGSSPQDADREHMV